MASIMSPSLFNKNISMKMNTLSSDGKRGWRKVNTERLAILCQDIEEATYEIDNTAALSNISRKCSTKIQYAILLFRNYRELVEEKGIKKSGNEYGDDWFMGITSGCSGIGLDGTEELLHGESAQNSFIVKLRAIVGLFSGISFIVLVSMKKFNYQRLDASAIFRDNKLECSELADSVNGYFDMTMYHVVASAGFLSSSG